MHNTTDDGLCILCGHSIDIDGYGHSEDCRFR
jgi:predicted nucleic acid-binding Zn ribbon protein